jgi:hypothetical protein
MFKGPVIARAPVFASLSVPSLTVVSPVLMLESDR